MLKIISIIVAIAYSFSVYANCEISESLKNKVCSSDYFKARNSKQLDEYLQYGVYKEGKLLNLEIDTIPDRTDSSLTYQQANRNIKFTLVSNIGGVSTDFTYVWDFGDGKIVENNLDTVIHSYETTGIFKMTVSVYDKDGKLLFSELTFILNDQASLSFSGKPLSEITASEYWENHLPLLSSTTVSGFKYQYAFPGYGICYTNGIDYFVQNGITYVYLPFYNCTEFDNIFY